MPPSLEERVAFLEGKVEEHSRGLGEFRDMIAELGSRITAVDQKLDRLREELVARIDAVHDRLDARINAVDEKVDRFREELASRIDALDNKVSRQFIWLVGLQVAVLLSVIGALFRG
jgi:uncharacterized coiled-coil protein SlyX